MQAITPQTRPSCRASSNIPADVVAQMSQLSRCDDNESQPGDAADQQVSRFQNEAASASNGVGRTHKGPCTTTDAPTVVDSLASDHSGVQHLKTL